MNVKYVIVEQSYTGRWTAKRGLSFATMEEGKAWIVANIREGYRKRYDVESRKIEADDTSERMTCQCCGGKYLARLGSITHHGYERPGGGYQTASCGGAKFLPFEKDHARLDMLIANLKEQAANLRSNAKKVKGEKVKLSISISDYSKPVDTYTRKRPLLHLEFDRAEFSKLAQEHVDNFRRNSISTFDDLKQRKEQDLLRRAKNTDDFRKECEKRRATWKHTHNYNKATKEWVAL